MKDILRRVGYIAGVIFFLMLPTFAGDYSCDYCVEHHGNEQQRNEKRKRYQHNRLEFIVKYAELTANEKAWLDKELKDYDSRRAAVWLEINKVRKEVEKKGDSLSDDQYLDYVKKLIELHSNLGAIHKDMGERLVDKFTPKKAYHVFDAIKNYNRDIAKKMRSK